MSLLKPASPRFDQAPYLQPPAGKLYVRSFIFSRRVDAPLARVHLIVRVIFVLCLSVAQLRMINAPQPDLVGAILLGIGGVGLFMSSGLQKRVARIYLLIMIPTLCSLFFTWTVFNPLPGHIVWIQPVYDGRLTLGLAVWQPLWLIIVALYFWWRRSLMLGIVLASIVAALAAYLLPVPSWPITQFAFYHPLTIVVSEPGLLVALTKVVGYTGMIFSTIALVVSSRDIELIGALRQLHLPQPVIFFLSTVCRALNLALTDYETIYQAQIARAINAQPRSFVRKVLDLGSVAVPLVAMMIRRSSEIGDALLARGYDLSRTPTDFYETVPFTFVDWLLLILSVGLLYLAVGPHPNLTTLFLR